MSKPFDYSKWDNIELSDDEDDVHPNIDKDSWFRLKHRSRVEREDKEEKDKKKINEEVSFIVLFGCMCLFMCVSSGSVVMFMCTLYTYKGAPSYFLILLRLHSNHIIHLHPLNINIKMAKANLRIKEINKILSKAAAAAATGDDFDSDDDLEDLDGLRSELKSLQNSNTDNQAKLDHYEKNKKWNVDNMCHVVEERTIVNNNVGGTEFSEGTGFALPEVMPVETAVAKEEGEKKKKVEEDVKKSAATDDKDSSEVPTEKMSGAKINDDAKTTATDQAIADALTTSKPKTNKAPQLQPQPDDPANSVSVSMLSYHEFTQRYADTVEKFMALDSMDKSKDFLLQNAHILLQENASNYLLLACLEDEMNGFHDKMKLVARQSQIISSIADLAKSLKLHPGNVIHPFFQRMQNKELYAGFMVAVEEFIQRVKARAITKRKEMDEERAREIKEQGANAEGAVDVADMPLEERLGPGGLDPLEVFESLPESMQIAFESREKEQLEAALRAMTPEEASHHMKRCIDSGLWNA